MTDNRQFTDGTTIGGVDVYYEDKKLAESPSQNSVAATDYIMLKDTDGTPHKIVKADFMSAVKDSMGTILNGLSNQTTVSKIPTLNGNTLGASTTDTIKEILKCGAINVDTPSNPDLLKNNYQNCIVQTTFYNNLYCPISTGYCIVFSINTSYSIQFAYNGTGTNTDFYVRFSSTTGSFKAWKKISFSD